MEYLHTLILHLKLKTTKRKIFLNKHGRIPGKGVHNVLGLRAWLGFWAQTSLKKTVRMVRTMVESRKIKVCL